MSATRSAGPNRRSLVLAVALIIVGSALLQPAAVSFATGPAATPAPKSAPGPAPVVDPVIAAAHAKEAADQAKLAAALAAQNAQLQVLTDLKARLISQIADARTALTKIGADLAVVEQKVADLGISIAAMRDKIAVLDANVAEASAQLVVIEAEEAAKAADLKARKAILAQHLQAAYETGQTSLLEAALSGGTFTDVLTRVDDLVVFGEQDKALALSIAQDQVDLASLHDTVSTDRTLTVTLRVEADAQQIELNARLVDFEAAQERLAALRLATVQDLSRKTSALHTVTANQKAIRAALEAGAAGIAKLQGQVDQVIFNQLGRGIIAPQFKGNLVWPMNGVITQGYGCTHNPLEPPLGSCDHWHTGIDIAGPMYEPIRADADGVVVFVGPNPYDPIPQAWIVVIAHSGNVNSWYGHIDDALFPPAVQVGQPVKSGDVIAYEGLTGHTTGPHLHWMIEVNHVFIDPHMLLAKHPLLPDPKPAKR